MIAALLRQGLLSGLVSLVLGACGNADPPAGAAPGAAALALDRLGGEAEIVLSPSGRGPEEGLVEVAGPWRLIGTVDGVRTWEAPLPIRPRTLFFHRAPDDMALYREGARRERALRYGYGLQSFQVPDSWQFTEKSLQVRRRLDEGRPEPSEYRLRYTRAVEREADLNRATSSRDDRSFVFRELQVDDTTRSGLFLPAPASVTFQVTVPDGAVLDLQALLVPPEVARPGVVSDGADLVVTVGGTEVLRVRPELARARAHRVDLGRWAGQEVALQFSTEPRATSDEDYVFVADPVVFVPQPDPPRVVMVFVDTLRQDHLSLMGYARPTTPRLDAWAQEAAVFEQARSVSPWTLPSTRTLLTGTQPEQWGQSETLQERFARAGWATTFIAGNVYLSSNFEMASGWAEHRCVNWPLAEVQVDRALDFLGAHEDRPVFLVVHLMDMHLPYTEPARYRRLFAGSRPEAFPADDFQRADVLRVHGEGTEEARAYVVDRYDNNLRYVDDEVSRLLEGLDPQDVVVLLSDHGEEFWDHDGFEHGHTLYDELLRVPLIVRAPGLAAGRYDTPVSLLDVAPTLATAAGMDTAGMVGWALQDLVAGSRRSAFGARPLAFGRPLYGDRSWGVLADAHKYTTEAGRERVFDLRTDPGEQDDLVEAGRPTAPLRRALAQALARPVEVGFRLEASRSRSGRDLSAELTVPGGVEAAVIGDDPTNSSEGEVTVDGERVRATWRGSGRGSREFFVVPTRPAQQVVDELELLVLDGDTTGRGAPLPRSTPDPVFDGKGETLLRARAGNRTVTLTWAVVPEVLEGDAAVQGYDAEVAGELKALGYVE